ncbi:HAD-IIB family hydrolase [Arthrobacter sp. MDT1-48-3]
MFLDVDGTYAHFGVVPVGHVLAVREARKAGHRVLLCTGRPLSMLSEGILGAGFDGIVASAGAYVEVAGEVLADCRFPADLAARTVAELDAQDAVYILESQERLYAPKAAIQRLGAMIEAYFRREPDGEAVGSSVILDALSPITNAVEVHFAKISVFDSPTPMDRLADRIGCDIAVIENSITGESRHAGELYQRGINKADGVAAVVARLGIDRADTVAIGDGDNDLEMIAYAGVGIAIEGSSPELMALADRTAAPPHSEGLVAAFADLGLFDEAV